MRFEKRNSLCHYGEVFGVVQERSVRSRLLLLLELVELVLEVCNGFQQGGILLLRRRKLLGGLFGLFLLLPEAFDGGVVLDQFQLELARLPNAKTWISAGKGMVSRCALACSSANRPSISMRRFSESYLRDTEKGC